MKTRRSDGEILASEEVTKCSAEMSVGGLAGVCLTGRRSRSGAVVRDCIIEGWGPSLLEDRRLLSIGSPTIEPFNTSPALFVENQGPDGIDDDPTGALHALYHADQGAAAPSLRGDLAAAAAADDDSPFVDPNLEQAVRDALDMPSGELTAAHLATLTTLHAAGAIDRQSGRYPGVYASGGAGLAGQPDQRHLGGWRGLTNLEGLSLGFNQGQRHLGGGGSDKPEIPVLGRKPDQRHLRGAAADKPGVAVRTLESAEL